MGMFIGGSGGGTWWTKCESDPRFNLSGRAYGMWGGSDAIDKAIRQKAKDLGIEPPEEIEIGFMKD